ncbi:YmfQ family protein [Clostridium perfringens]|nr:YmfQ family protein [Clostridium perfringens]
MYGLNKYGTISYSMDSLDDTIEKNDIIDLSKYVPKIISDISEFKNIYISQGLELSILNKHIKDLQNQLFVNKATWGLDFFERDYGIKTDISKTYEERREVILAKKRGTGTVTKEMIKNTAKAFTNVDVDVIENKDYSFTVKFIGEKGIPRNLQDFKDMLEEIKPAHLAYNLEFTYTVWDFLKEKNLTWASASNKTWDELKVYDDEKE